MLRLTELKLPLDHPCEALCATILKRLELAGDELLGVSNIYRHCEQSEAIQNARDMTGCGLPRFAPNDGFNRLLHNDPPCCD